MSKKASVYLIHFAEPFKHARHYLGSAVNVESRMSDHRKGRGARLMQVVTEAGIDWQVARVWEEGGRLLEKKFKKAKHNVQLCPICSQTA